MSATIKFDFHLTLTRGGAARVTKGWPAGLRSDERVMKLHMEVPASLFGTPELRANIVVPDEGMPALQIDVEGAAKMLSTALNVDVVSVRLEEPTQN